MQRLESLFVSDNNLFRLVSNPDGKLQLFVDEYCDLQNVIGLKISGQPDMVIPPEMVNTITVESFGKSIYLTFDENSELKGCIGVHSEERWTCFYFDIDYKLLIHVQPVDSKYNYETYEHPTIPVPTIEESLKELEKSNMKVEEQLSSMMEEIDSINAAIASMEKLETTNKN